MSKIFFVTGKSCTGKDTIFRKLMQNPELSLKSVTGYTTRPMRSDEKNGGEYFFVDEKRLDDLQEQGRVIERRTYDTVEGLWHYFTADDGQIKTDSGNYLYIGTLESYVQFVRYYGGDTVVPVYIEVENGERLERAVKRERRQKEPKYAELCRRFLADEEDFKEENIKKAGIVKRYKNDDLDRCLAEIIHDIKTYIQ